LAKYKYTALDVRGRHVRGYADARDDGDFERVMRAQGLVPLRHTQESEATSGYRLKSNEVGEFSRQLANMLGSGITAVRAMEILKDRDYKEKLSGVYKAMYRDVQRGNTLSEAMKNRGRSFPELLVNMYSSGEASGQLERVADKMALHYEKEHKLNGKVRAAMTYPIVLLAVTVAVVMLVFIGILPTFFTLFEDIELPLITRIMLAISTFLRGYWLYLLIGVLSLVALAQYLLRIHSIRVWFDRLKLRIRVIGKLLKTIYTARFSRTLSSLYSSGITMIRALEISSTILANKYIEGQFAEVIRQVRNGEPLSSAVGAVDGFDKKLSTTILIGEESGRLDSMLVSTAESFDYDAEMATERLVALIQPAMIVIMAVVVGSIILSVMTPMLTLYQSL
jgi:type IV pilus assembly protein PilC